jgi:hypothetical protein
MIPSGGATELATVARRYDAHWLLAWDMFSRPDTSRALRRLGARADGIDVAREYEDATAASTGSAGEGAGGPSRAASVIAACAALEVGLRIQDWREDRGSLARALEQPVRLRPDGQPTSAASSAWRRSGGASTS